MRGTMLMKSMLPSRTDDTSTTRPRCQAMKPRINTEPHSVTSMISAEMFTWSGSLGLALRIHPHEDEAAERAGQHWNRQRDHDAPQRELGAEDRQLPSHRAAIAD